MAVWMRKAYSILSIISLCLAAIIFFCLLVINSPDVYKKHTNDIWTIQDPNLICTRFIFLYVFILF